MRNPFKNLFFTPDDLGMHGYTIEEITKKMQRLETTDESSLIEFAKNVQAVFEADTKQKENLTRRSSGTLVKRRAP